MDGIRFWPYNDELTAPKLKSTRLPRLVFNSVLAASAVLLPRFLSLPIHLSRPNPLCFLVAPTSAPKPNATYIRTFYDG